jgi:hypothetical protein
VLNHQAVICRRPLTAREIAPLPYEKQQMGADLNGR